MPGTKDLTPVTTPLRFSMPIPVFDGSSVTLCTLLSTIEPGLPSISLEGIKIETSNSPTEFLKAAITNSGFVFPSGKITFAVTNGPHLAPPGLDLALALSILLTTEQIPADYANYIASGTLLPNGTVEVAPAPLAHAEAARVFRKPLLLAAHDTPYASLITEAEINGITNLADLLTGLPPNKTQHAITRRKYTNPDLADLRGHRDAIRALTIAAAGHHPIFFTGAPGCGRTMLARRLPSVLPQLTHEQAVEHMTLVTNASYTRLDPFSLTPPFRAPHHTISRAGLLGSPRYPLGEVSLANRGALFLDEYDEFDTSALDALFDAITQGSHQIRYKNRDHTRPARTLVVAAASLVSSPESRSARHRDFIRQRLLRHESAFQIHCRVHRPTAADVEAGPIAKSAEVRSCVEAAREVQTARYGNSKTPTNGQIPELHLLKKINLSHDVETYADSYMKQPEEWGEATFKNTLRIARTIADLDHSPTVAFPHFQEALTLSTPYPYQEDFGQ